MVARDSPRTLRHQELVRCCPRTKHTGWEGGCCMGGAKHLPRQEGRACGGWRLVGHEPCGEGPGMSADRAQLSLLKLPESSLQPALWPAFLPCTVIAPSGDGDLKAWLPLLHFYNSPQQRTHQICAYWNSATTTKTPLPMKQKELSSSLFFFFLPPAGMSFWQIISPSLGFLTGKQVLQMFYKVWIWVLLWVSALKVELGHFSQLQWGLSLPWSLPHITEPLSQRLSKSLSYYQKWLNL